LKVPMSVDLLRQLCQELPGWPALTQLGFDDLLWVTASTIALFGALRGGELFTSRKSTRPIMTGAWVKVVERAGARPLIKISVPLPKTKPGDAFQTDTVATPRGEVALSPVRALAHYRARAAREGINVLGAAPAFRRQNGEVLSRDFMVNTAKRLAARAQLTFVDDEGKPIPFKATSWRAGYVQSALQSGLSKIQIRATGRWESTGGMMAYTVKEEDAFQRAADSIGQRRSSSSAASQVVGVSSSSYFME